MDAKIIGAQPVSRMCAVCGIENASGLHARFFELESGELAGSFEPAPEHQGYPGRLHGGLASALLDETIGRAVNLTDPGAWGVTLELNVRFRRPVPLDSTVVAIGRITSDGGRIFEGSGEIRLEDGTVAVEATGKYMRLPIERIAQGDFTAEDWFADPRRLPETL